MAVNPEEPSISNDVGAFYPFTPKETFVDPTTGETSSYDNYKQLTSRSIVSSDVSNIKVREITPKDKHDAYRIFIKRDSPLK